MERPDWLVEAEPIFVFASVGERRIARGLLITCVREPLPLSCQNPEQVVLLYVPYRENVCYGNVCYGRYLDFAAHSRYEYVRMHVCTMCIWHTTYAATINTKAYHIHRGTLVLLATCICTHCFFAAASRHSRRYRYVVEESLHPCLTAASQ